MTPVVFLELAMPDVDLPSFDPFFLAIRLSKRLLNKIQAVETIGRKHGLVLAVFETSAEDAELPGTLSEVSSIELHVADELVWFRVFGHPLDTLQQVRRCISAYERPTVVHVVKPIARAANLGNLY